MGYGAIPGWEYESQMSSGHKRETSENQLLQEHIQKWQEFLEYDDSVPETKISNKDPKYPRYMVLNAFPAELGLEIQTMLLDGVVKEENKQKELKRILDELLQIPPTEEAAVASVQAELKENFIKRRLLQNQVERGLQNGNGESKMVGLLEEKERLEQQRFGVLRELRRQDIPKFKEIIKNVLELLKSGQPVN